MNRTRRIALTSGVLVALSAPAAAATTGNLYPLGPQPNWLVGSQTIVTQPQPGVWQIELPQVALSLAATKWAMSWACPVPGSEISSVSWGSLRLAGPSALGEEVVTEFGTEFLLPDVDLPQSPNDGQQYVVALPPGRCSATLRLRQSEDVAQHKRVYWIGQPGVVVRDLQPPTVVIRDLAGALFNAQATSTTVNWTANDNFGADGMLTQSVTVGGFPKWSGAVGPGDHSALVDLGGLHDGAHRVRVTVAGDGTAAGVAESTIIVDRTPPSVSPPVGTPSGSPGLEAFTWSATDATTNVRTSQLEINTATDGSAGGTWVGVGPVASGGTPTAHLVVDTSVVSDGVHATRVRAVDFAGNVGYSAHGEVVVDTTPPVVAIEPPPAGHVRNATLLVRVDDNLASRLSLGMTSIAANSAPDGSGSGTWVPVRAPERLAPGTHRLTVDLSALGDGRHLVRVTTGNGGGLEPYLQTSADVVVSVDATSPTVSDVTIRRTTPQLVTLSWLADDARSGVASARVDWLDGAAWTNLASIPAGAGTGTITVDTSSLPTGVQQLRLVVTDSAGNLAIAHLPNGLVVDRTPPSLTGLRVVGPPWAVSWVVTALSSGDTCPTQVLVNGPHTNGTWREVATIAPALGGQSVVLPLDGYAPGGYRVRIVACDTTGNTTTLETGGIALGIPASGNDAGDRLSAGIADRPATLVGGRPRYTQRLVTGQGLVVTGQWTDASGGAVGDTRLVVRVPGGATVATRTGTDGRFRVAVRPIRSGFITFARADGVAIPRDRTLADLRVIVRPAVSFTASRTTAVALGSAVIFSGRVRPRASRLAIATPKAVVLEWQDPVRRVWRPVVNTRVQRDGTYRIPWRFQAAGQRIPMRLRVPKELGWGLEATTSRTIVIDVR